MNLTTEQPRKLYVSIYSNPEYENFSYHFDYVTIIVIASFIFLIPTVYATIKMVLFRNPQKSSTDIHPYVYKSFIYMQVSKVICSILDLVFIRIPLTTILTSYYSTLKRDSPLRIFTASYFSLNNLSQLFTVLFCLIRLLVFINKEERLETYRCIFWIWSITSVIFCAMIYIIHFLFGVVCLSILFPFQYGAILVTSSLYESRLSAVVEVVFNAVICICVVVTTLLMLVKLKNMKRLSSISSKNTKAEKTLTITMFIILFPTVLDMFITIINLLATQYTSYFMLLRPILHDFRANIVSCYFYWTHPYFEKKTTVTNVLSTMPRSNT